MISAGGRPEADLYEIKSQVARSEQGVVSAENALDLAWLSLKQSLRLRSDLEMSLEPLSEEQLRNLESESYTYENLYEYSSVNQPGMKAAKLRLEAAKLGEGMARAAFFLLVWKYICRIPLFKCKNTQFLQHHRQQGHPRYPH